MRAGAAPLGEGFAQDAHGTLTCDRCGESIPIEPNTTPDGWRFLMSNVATVTADLCPSCVEDIMDQVAVQP